jgi:hypothetical protein
MVDPEKVRQGKKYRAAGNRFQSRVREDLEEEGWIVFRNSNDVEFSEKMDDCLRELPLGGEIPCGMFKQAKTKWVYNPVIHRRIPIGMSSGFPDFICIKKLFGEFEVQFVESKMTGELDREEKDKIEWIKNNLKIPVIIASKGEKRGEIIYEHFL